MKKLLLAAAAVAMPVGIIASTAGVSGAGAPKIDVSHATIACTSVTGTAKFAPALTIGGVLPENTNVKIAFSGCTVTGAAGVSGVTGSGSGVLHSATNNAVALLGPVPTTGSINIKWKTTSGKLLSKTTSVTPSAITGGTPSDGYASLAVVLGSATVTGDFTGTDSGASSSMYAETTQTVGAITVSATGSKGLKSVSLGTDGTHTTPNSLNLG